MYLAYNTAGVENLGKPAVMTACKRFLHDARTGVTMRQKPGLRIVGTDLASEDAEFDPVAVKEGVAKCIDDVVAALTKPLTEAEKSPRVKVEKQERIIFKGSFEEVNRFFYKNGWAAGFQVAPPSEEAVREMMSGTDLPPDYVVARIPPRMGKATVEKIAVNAVMAGCLPTYMPVLIAAIQACLGPEIAVEGYTCSVASWAPLLMVNGPIRKDIGVNSGMALFSPYYKPNTAIAHAFGFITQNIGGIRPGIEDMAGMGHEGRLGMCIAENEEDSPWPSLHVEKGFKKDDNTVTLFYPNCRSWSTGPLFGGWAGDAATILRRICNNMSTFGVVPGLCLIMMPGAAKMLAKEDWSKKEVLAHIVEYARRPLSALGEWPFGQGGVGPDRFAMGKELKIHDPAWTRRIFLNTDHMLICVAGGAAESSYILSLGGGGTYGGPATRKIELPKNWAVLVKKYKDVVPTYVRY